MTYKDRLEELLSDSIQKSEACIRHVRAEAANNPEAGIGEGEKFFEEWEAAELAYTDFLDFIKMNQISSGDLMPDERA